MARNFRNTLIGVERGLACLPWFSRLFWMSLFFLLLPQRSLAAVDVLTSPENVVNGGVAELASALLFTIDDDDFAGASPESPIYLRVELPADVVLGQTVVGPNQPPIFLALSTVANGGGPLPQMVASETAVALVRHVAGESAIWLRISESSGSWLEIGGQDGPPTEINPVAFQIGVTSQDSFGFTWPLYQLGWANLPFNTSDPDTSGNPVGSADTTIKLDLSQGAFPEGSQIHASFSAYSGATGVETALADSGINEGTELEMALMPSALIAMVLQRSAEPTPGLFLNTLPEPILNLTACETTGDMTVNIGLDTLPNASNLNPVYLRLQLSNQASLCETLVTPGAVPESPIYLALKLPEGLSGELVAPPDTASIVRWVAGENAVWVKINHPSTDWVDGVVNAAGVLPAASFTIGQTAGESLAWNQTAHAMGRANLPANTDDLTETASVSTDLKVDFSAGGISALSPELWVYARTYSQTVGVEAAVPDNQIQLGVSLGHEDGGVLGFLAEGPVLWDGVVLSSVPKELEPDGSCETAGNLGLTIGADLFPIAGPSNPVYIRVDLPQDISLCETRVVPGQNDPILLAISLENTASANKVIAPADTASIVRWVSGESEFWLKIQAPTHSWLETGNGLSAPSMEERVKLGLGIDAATTLIVNEALYANDKANLPGNTRLSDWPANFEPVSTSLGLDLSQAAMVPDLQPGGNWRAYATVDPTAWLHVGDVETQPDLGSVPAGVPYSVFFQGTRDIGYTTPVAVFPPVVVQGPEIVTMEALVADDINPVEFKWFDRDTNVIVSEFQSIIFDPVPTGTVKLRLEMVDHLGRLTTSEGVLLVDPGEFDLNQDGESDIEDLYFALPDWGKTHDILFLVSIPLD